MRVPTYKSQAKFSNRSGGINMSVRASPGALSAGSQAMASFGDQAMKTSLQFYEIERRNDYEAQKQKGIVEYAKELESIKEQTRQKPSNVADTYFDTEAEKARLRISKNFTNDVAKRDYLNESEKDFINKRVSVRAEVSNRRINDQASTHLSRVAQLQNDAVYGNAAEKHAALNELFGDKPNKIPGMFDKLKNLGYYSSTQSITATNKMMAAITEGNIITTFDALGTLEEKRKYLESFKDKPPASLGNVKIRQLTRGFRAEINGLVREQKLAIREFKVDIKDASYVLKNGGEVDDKIINGFATKAQNLNDADSIELVKRLNLQKIVMSGLKKSSPQEVVNYISNLKKNGFAGVEGVGLDSRFEVDLVKDAETFLTNMRTQLASDPISFAAKTGIIKNFVPLNFDDPTSLGETLMVRSQQASVVSARYENPIKYFTQDELSSLSAKFQNSTTDQKIGLFGVMQSVFGSKTKDVLVEINQKGPEFAHIGGLLLTKNIDSATLAMQGYDLMKSNIKASEYTSTNVVPAYSDTIGTSLTELAPSVKGSSISVTEAIYTKLANERGLVNFNSEVFGEAVQRSLGAVFVEGEQVSGGVQDVNDHPTLIPSSMNPDMFEDMIKSLDALNFETNNIDKSLMENIKDGDFNMYAIGNGVYKFGRGKKGTTTFQYAADLDGNELILNVYDFFEIEQ